MEEVTVEVLDYLRERMEIRNMALCKRYFPISFREDVAYINKKEIILPMLKEISDKEVRNSYANQFHESSHAQFSSLDFERAKKVIRENKLDMTKAQHLLNIIDDYRVNTLQLYSHPGAGRLMNTVFKEWVKDRTYENVVDALLPVVSDYPTNLKLSKEDQEKLKKAVKLVKPVIEHLDLTGCLKVLPKVYDIFFEREDGDSEWQHSREDEKFRQDSEMLGIKSNKGNVKKSLKKMKKAQKAKPKESKDSKDIEKAESKRIDKEVKATVKELKKIQEKTRKGKMNMWRELKEIESEYKENSALEITHKIVREFSASEYQIEAKKYKNEINILVRDLKKIITFANRWATRQSSGKLDTRKAYTIVTNGNYNIFKSKNQKDVGNMAVLILVDCSSSMRGNRIAHAKRAVIVLHEVFRRLKIKHMIVGFTGDLPGAGMSVNHLIYKAWNNNKVAVTLSSLRALYQNRDGDTLNIAMKYFKNIQETHKLTIVISDGSPAASGYGGAKAKEHTVMAQKKMKKKGIKLINVGIGIGYRMPERYVNKVKVDDVSKLPKTLMRMIRKEIRY